MLTVEHVLRKYIAIGADGTRAARVQDEWLARSRIDQIEYYVGLFGSHERIGALWDATDDEPANIFWPIFINWWNACDGTFGWRKIILDTLRRRTRDCAPKEFQIGEDCSFLDTLSWPLTVYRGCGRRQVRGISWTTDRTVAEYFARGGRFPMPRDPVIARALIERSGVFFVSAERKESEVVVDPYNVRRLRLEAMRPSG